MRYEFQVLIDLNAFVETFVYVALMQWMRHMEDNNIYNSYGKFGLNICCSVIS